MKSQRLGKYEDLSVEYYDASRHPTCANFREASAQLVNNWLEAASEKQKVCEIGPGKSLVAEILSEKGVTLHNLSLVDSSRSMLAYSRRWISEGACLVLGDAYSLPLKSASIDLMVSSLGDPYNQIQFWKEASRIIKPGGVMLFTVPSYEWASAFRQKDLERRNLAEFELSSGVRVWVPSFIHEVDTQVKLIESCTFKVSDIEHISITSLKGLPLSTKLMPERGKSAEIVTGFRAKKKD